MDINHLITLYPEIYHMAEDGSWPSIQSFGLLSTAAILDLFRVKPDLRQTLERNRRPDRFFLSDKKIGTMCLRDQTPMNDGGLRKCLPPEITPSDWYHFLNQRVFFWLKRERLERLSTGRIYRKRTHDILTIDTAKLVKKHFGKIKLSPINSGCTSPGQQPRDYNTFLPIPDYPYDELNLKRKGIHPVVELTVDYSVPDIKDFVIKVERVKGTNILELVYAKKG